MEEEEQEEGERCQSPAGKKCMGRPTRSGRVGMMKDAWRRSKPASCGGWDEGGDAGIGRPKWSAMVGFISGRAELLFSPCELVCEPSACFSEFCFCSVESAGWPPSWGTSGETLAQSAATIWTLLECDGGWF